MPRRSRGSSDLSKDAPICLSWDRRNSVWLGVMRGLGPIPGCATPPPLASGEDFLGHTPSVGNFDVEPKKQQPLV